MFLSAVYPFRDGRFDELAYLHENTFCQTEMPVPVRRFPSRPRLHSHTRAEHTTRHNLRRFLRSYLDDHELRGSIRKRVFKAGFVQDLEIRMLVADKSFLLEGMNDDTDARSGYAQHVGDELVREPECLRFHSVCAKRSHLAKRCSRL